MIYILLIGVAIDMQVIGLKKPVRVYGSVLACLRGVWMVESSIPGRQRRNK